MDSQSAKEDTGQQQGGKDMQANMPLDSFSKHDERQGGQRRVINIKRRPFPLGGMTTTRAVGIAAGSQLEISPKTRSHPGRSGSRFRCHGLQASGSKCDDAARG